MGLVLFLGRILCFDRDTGGLHRPRRLRLALFLRQVLQRLLGKRLADIVECRHELRQRGFLAGVLRQDVAEQ